MVMAPAGNTFGETQLFLFCFDNISNFVSFPRKPISSSEQEFLGDFRGATGGFLSK